MYISFCSYAAVKRMIEMMSKYVTKCADQRALSLQRATPARGLWCKHTLSSFWWGLRI